MTLSLKQRSSNPHKVVSQMKSGLRLQRIDASGMKGNSQEKMALAINGRSRDPDMGWNITGKEEMVGQVGIPAMQSMEVQLSRWPQ